jgi:hypothetical protein
MHFSSFILVLVDYAVGIDLEVVLLTQLAVKYVIPSVTLFADFQYKT